MIGKLFASEGANAALVVVLSGTVATLVANGPGRASLGQTLFRVLSNPVPRSVQPGIRGGLRSLAAEGRAAA
jgi:hypothetical protein